jgi:predicted branched-subunit amino acid permease
MTNTLLVRDPSALTETAETRQQLPVARRDAFAVAPGMVPFGIALGVTIATTGFGDLAGLLGGPAVYGGSAQLTAVTLLDQGVALVALVISAVIVNMRLMLYSAALAPRFRHQPRWFRWIAPHFIIDQTYLLASARGELSPGEFRRYWGWLGGFVLVIWTSAIGIGIALAPVLPEMPHLVFVGTAMFLGMLMPRLVSRPTVAAAMAGCVAAILVGSMVPELGIVAGAMAGVAAGMAVSRR